MVETIRTDIPFSYGVMGSISGLVQAGFMVCALLAGFWTVRFGALPMILASIALCAVALGGLAFAPNIGAMAVLLTVLGGCAATIWVPMVEVAKDFIPKKHQGKALGMMSSGTSYGVFVNSFLLTSLMASHGWRSLWLVTSALVGMLALLACIRLRRTRQPATEMVAPERTSMAARWKVLPKGLTAAILFMMFLNGLSCMPYQTYLSAFLQNEAGYSADTAARIWRVIGIVGMVGGFAIGWLADRITVRRGMVVTYGVLAASCFLLVQTSGGTSMAMLHAAAITFGMSFYAIFGLVPAYISHAFGQGSAALVFAFGNIALGLGGIVGNVLGGALKLSTGSFEPIYLVMLGAAVCSAVLSALMPSEHAASRGALSTPA